MLVGLAVLVTLHTAAPAADPCSAGPERQASGRVAVNLSLRWTPELRVARPCIPHAWRLKLPPTAPPPHAAPGRASPCEQSGEGREDKELERTPAPYSMFWLPEESPLLSSGPGAGAPLGIPGALGGFGAVCDDSVETDFDREPAIALALDLGPLRAALTGRPAL